MSENIKWKTFTQLTKMCNCSYRFLKDYIKLHDDLYNLFKPYYDGNKHLYPPAVYNPLLKKILG